MSLFAYWKKLKKNQLKIFEILYHYSFIKNRIHIRHSGLSGIVLLVFLKDGFPLSRE